MDCQDPSCSGHGFCVSGTCICRSEISFRQGNIFCALFVNILQDFLKNNRFYFCSIFVDRKGWRGTNCDQVDDDEKQVKRQNQRHHPRYHNDHHHNHNNHHHHHDNPNHDWQCLPNCSGHGSFKAELGKCVCHRGFTGNDCAIGEITMINMIILVMLMMMMKKMARMTQTLTKMTFQRCAILIVGSEATAKVASVFATRGGEVGIKSSLQIILSSKYQFLQC